MKAEKRFSLDGLVLIVDWDNEKVVEKSLAKGTYYYTFYLEGTFAGWRTRKEIILQYPRKGNKNEC